MKEIRKSISRARDEHRKILEEISKINNSVQYSPQHPRNNGLAENSVYQSQDIDDLDGFHNRSVFTSGVGEVFVDEVIQHRSSARKH